MLATGLKQMPVLYGVGDPVEAVGILADKIVHCHMKDATWSDKPAQEWGEEVVLGSGQADIPRIVSKLRAQGYTGPLVIEREAGDNRVGDIKEGIRLPPPILWDYTVRSAADVLG